MIVEVMLTDDVYRRIQRRVDYLRRKDASYTVARYIAGIAALDARNRLMDGAALRQIENEVNELARIQIRPHA